MNSVFLFFTVIRTLTNTALCNEKGMRFDWNLYNFSHFLHKCSLSRQVISELQDAQNANKTTLKCGSPKDKIPKKRLAKGTVPPNKTPKNSLENYLTRTPAKM